LPAEWLPLVLFAALLVALWGWYLAATRTRRHNMRRQRIAVHGETDAEVLLEAAGYDIVDRQVTERWQIWVDGQAVEVTCRADLLVSDSEGRRYVAEVKTGARAVRPKLPATRRQLLEYWHVFAVEGLLLVDMEARELHTVSFLEPETADAK
jgi:hypothetical protein